MIGKGEGIQHRLTVTRFAVQSPALTCTSVGLLFFGCVGCPSSIARCIRSSCSRPTFTVGARTLPLEIFFGYDQTLFDSSTQLC
jgi:hypothetical protein